jgi:DNA-binding CsgD family transcriptional regulator
MTPGVGRLSDLQLRIEALSIAGSTPSQIARLVGLKPGSVKRHLEKIQGVRAFEKLTGRPVAPLRRLEAAAVQDLVSQGLTHRTIAERFGVSRSHIDRVLAQGRNRA